MPPDLFAPLAALTLTAGTFVAIWIAGLISERGLGHGVGLILFVGIATALPSLGLVSARVVLRGEEPGWMPLVALATLFGAMAAVAFVDGAERRLPPNPAAREADPVWRRAYLPVRLGAGGVTASIVVATIVNVSPHLPDRVFGRVGSGAAANVAVLAGFWLLTLLFVFFGLSRDWRPHVRVAEAIGDSPSLDEVRETEARLGVALALMIATLAFVPMLLVGLRLLDVFIGAGAMLILAFVGSDVVAKARGRRALPEL